ncbi:MAG TPA: SpoIIE family protein phosphatase [Oscillatoriales cyanobacterium M59_W2019_021]|nr:SpoIIE family protein phosphatase [Oscillatoriales cyanobacterium M59_W2019_021]
MIAKLNPKFKNFKWLKASPYLPVWLSWIAGIGCSAFASGVAWNWETTQLQEEFPQRANNLALALQQSIDEYLQVPRAMGAFYDSSERVTAEEFARFSKVFLTREPGILELGWLEYVPGDERSRYEKNRQLEDPNFRIRNCEGSNRELPLEARAEYYPTIYLEMPTLDRAATPEEYRAAAPEEYRPEVGCDRAANPISRLSIDRAKTFEIAIATPHLSRNDSAVSIFEIYQPIYSIPASTQLSTEAVSDKKLKGIIYLSIDIQEVISNSIGALSLEDLNFYLFDLSFDRLDSSLIKSLYQENSELLLFYNSRTREFIQDKSKIPTLKTGTTNYCPYGRDGSTCVRTLNVADREWSVLIVPRASTDKVASRAIATLTIGLFLTSLLATYLTHVTQRTLKTEAVNRSLNTELEITHKVHRMLLPKEREFVGIDGLEIAGFMEPAADVGGDYYDVLFQEGRLLIGIGDVTGHGLESGVLTIVVQTAVRTLLANRETDSKKILEVLNRVICGSVRRMNSDKSLTLALLEYQDRKLQLSGQHEEAIVIRKNGKIERIDTIDLGFPIGLEDDIARFVNCASIELNSGDVVILYTDGIPEAENPYGKRYGVDRLAQVARRHAHQDARDIQRAIVADLKQYISTQKIYDDITLLVLKQG